MFFQALAAFCFTCAWLRYKFGQAPAMRPVPVQVRRDSEVTLPRKVSVTEANAKGAVIACMR
jgi:hypothetical protein